MRVCRWIVGVVFLGLTAPFVGLTPAVGRAQGPVVQATFHGIGDLPGGPILSTVRDATRVGTTIYAVGGSAAKNQPCSPQPGCFATDTAVLWTWDGVTGALTALPNIVANNNTSAVLAAAITPDGDYIASQARDAAVGNSRVAVRVTRAGLTNVNLNAAPYTVFAAPTAATAISADGTILYGTVNSNSRIARFDVAAGTTTLIPLLDPGDIGNQTPPKTASSDGSIVVGTSFFAPYSGSTNGRAFRYVHDAGVSAIPLLSEAGATWNKSLAVSPDGNLTLLAGNSAALPRGLVYLYDAASGAQTNLGSPNLAWLPANAAAMTPDGSLVLVTFVDPNNSSSRYPYIHNSHGWFLLSSILAAAGVDLAPDVVNDAWSMEGGTGFGLSTDGTLVFGQAFHETPTTRQLEGFVADFAPGFLASFNPVPVAPASTAIAGTWLFPQVDAPENPVILFLLADGTYFQIEAGVPANDPGGDNGFERGLYAWDAGSNVFSVTTLQDTNGYNGLSGPNGMFLLRAEVAGDELTLYIDGCREDPECRLGPGTRIGGGAVSIVGGWVGGNPSQSDSSMVMLFLQDGTYYMAGDDAADAGGNDGIEKGTYTWDAVTGAISITTTVDTNGQHGFSHPPPGARTLQLSADELMFTYSEAGGEATLTRIVDPSTVVPVITSASSAQGVVGAPFAYTVTATRALSYAASGLPAGLSINAATGLISGTPTASGTFSVSISATNSFPGVGAAVLDLVIVDNVTRTGFYAPVNAGLNTAKGGSTVPLKFNVHVNGVEKTDTSGLAFSVVSIDCESGAVGQAVEFVTTGGTSLRYSGHQFIQNWKTPSAAGCYVVRMTTLADGLSLDATFTLR